MAHQRLSRLFGLCRQSHTLCPCRSPPLVGDPAQHRPGSQVDSVIIAFAQFMGSLDSVRLGLSQRLDNATNVVVADIAPIEGEIRIKRSLSENDIFDLVNRYFNPPSAETNASKDSASVLGDK